jgi:hypothetical protein
MKRLIVLASIAAATIAFGAASKSMCIKQKDGTYKCKASGKIMKEPCCNNPEEPKK